MSISMSLEKVTETEETPQFRSMNLPYVAYIGVVNAKVHPSGSPEIPGKLRVEY